MDISNTMCATGTRQLILETKENQEKIVSAVQKVLEAQKIAYGITGGAQGFDALFAKACILSGVKYSVLLPHPTYLDYYWQGNGSKLTSKETLLDLQQMLDCAAKIEIMYKTLYVGGVHVNFKRNVDMLERSGKVLAWAAKERSSGTAHCVKTALGMGRQLFQIKHYEVLGP